MLPNWRLERSSSGFLCPCRGLGHPGCFDLTGRVRSEDFWKCCIEQLDLFHRINLVDLESYKFSGSNMVAFFSFIYS
ncbi:hypothetical protein PanWU01x14_223610 [Parasponia andersonii]|uniref:Uncharacterized protein n=1 Tax=Parasponia andersonii TaxID=3476 RepID=A0A2P5BNM3_PARAD|nr:hypothetical protein PanWU01x14_223610 [Parasponia andersonii]